MKYYQLYKDGVKYARELNGERLANIALATMSRNYPDNVWMLEETTLSSESEETKKFWNRSAALYMKGV